MTQETKKFSELASFTKKQLEADEAVKRHKYVLYGGAMGGGKSYWLRWELLRLLLSYFAVHKKRHVTVALFCEDYPALKDRHLSKVKYEFPPWLGTLKESDNNFVLKEEYGGGIIAFRNLDDPSKYQSSEFAAEAVDELTKNKREVFDFLRTRLRWPGIPDTRFIAATNPGGIGHEWVKRFWLDRDFDPNETESEQFAYIRALAADNPHLDPSYLTSLGSLPEDMRKAFVDGDWNLFKGQYFREWRDALHVCEPFDVKPYHKKFLCGDYGYAAPSAVYWCFKDADGIVYAYRELYETQLTFEKLTKEIVARTPRDEKLDYWVFDPAIWAKKGETELSGAEIMEQTYRQTTGSSLLLLKGNNDRLNGWNVVRSHLAPIMTEKGLRAKFQAFRTCTNLIRTFPAMVYDTNKPEDLDSDGEDHACFAKGTLVDGVPIENIGAITGEREVFEFEIGGVSLRASTDHPVCTQRGLVKIDALRYDDVVWQRALFSTVSNGLGIRTLLHGLSGNTFWALVRQIEAIVRDCTDTFGGKRTVRSLLGITFIIATGILGTICLITWSWFSGVNTLLFILEHQRVENGPEGTSRQRSRRLQAGQRPKKGKNDEEKSDSQTRSFSSIGRWLLAPVIYVVKCTKREATVERGSVTSTAVKKRFVGREPVYNLRTKSGMYRANGILVSNCDSLRYGLMSRPKESPKLRTGADLLLFNREKPKAKHLQPYL